MKKLWLSAIAAAFMVAGTAAHAGDHGRGHRDYDRHDRYEHHGYERGDHWGRPHYREIREVYYRPANVYYRPARYYPAPVYYESRGRDYDNDIHGSINVGFGF